MQAPAAPDEPDLDLHLHWADGRLRQDVDASDRHWAFRQFSEMVVHDGVGHRSILMQPSRAGAPTLLGFRVALAAGAPAELVTWISMEEKQARRSDGVDVAIGVGDGTLDPEAVPLAYTRLDGARMAAEWREVRVDLSAYAGTTVWLVFAARDPARRGDWLLWGDPRVRLRDVPTPAVVDLARADPAATRPRAAPWSEATIFKPYSLFNAETAQWNMGDWLRRSFPWLDALRLFSALGGNWGPSLAADYADAVGDSPAANSETERRWAEHYEFFRDGPAWRDRPLPARFQFDTLDALTGLAAASGLALHLNLAGAPEAFTGGAGYYRNYHFNERPVVDEAGWRTYVATLFEHLASQPWYPRARFSLFTEPNCVWVDAEGVTTRVGFQGDAEAFARQYLWTWQALAPHVAPGQVYLGPFVIEPEAGTPPGADVPTYLHALQTRFAAAGEPLPSWSAFAFNLYETPQLGLDGFAASKIDVARTLVARALPPPALPLRIDELGVHPLVEQAFAQATNVKLGTTRWEMAWTAEVMALLLERDVTRAATWFPVLIAYPPDQRLKAWAAYAFLSAVVGQVDLTAAADGRLDVVRAPASAGPPVEVRLASRHADRVGALWSPTPAGGMRLALWSFPRFLRTDDAPGPDAAPRAVTVRLPGAAEPRTVRLLGFDDQLAASGVVARATEVLSVRTFPALPRLVRATVDAPDGTLALTLRPGDLWLVELE